MRPTRDTALLRIAELVGGRKLRWLPGNSATGDYDGRARTLEIFDVEARDQRAVLRRMGSIRGEVESLIGGPLVIIFHTPAETARLFPQMSFRRTYPALAASIARRMAHDLPSGPSIEPSEIPRLTFGEADAA